MNDPRLGTGVLGSIGTQIEAYAPSVDLYLQVYDSNIGFNGLLTIAVYLRARKKEQRLHEFFVSK